MSDAESPVESARILQDRLRPALIRRFGIDPRGLAAFRVALAVTLLVDLAFLRIPNLVVFYTDRGVLPRSVLAEHSPLLAELSLHAVSGTTWYQALMALVAAGFALALLVGYRTWLAGVVSLVLLASLNARNPFVLNGADVLLMVLLFLALFLPLGRRWSVDALGSAPADDPDRSSPLVANAATAALLVQVVAIFATNAVFKYRSGRWTAGEGALYAFQLDQHTILLGNYLAGYPTLLWVANWAWFGLLAGSILLVALTGRARAVLVGLFLGSFLGMSVSLSVGLFPLVLAVAMIPFLPPPVWDAVEPRLERAAQSIGNRLPERVVNRSRPADGSRSRSADGSRSRPADGSRSRPPEVVRQRVLPVALSLLLVVVLVGNVWALGYGQPEATTEVVDAEDHRWEMFSLEAPGYGWHVVTVELDDGREVDALGRADVRPPPEHPPDVSQTYPDVRWRQFMGDLQGNEPILRSFGEYACSRADDRHDASPERVQVVYVGQPVDLDEEPEPFEIELLDEEC